MQLTTPSSPSWGGILAALLATVVLRVHNRHLHLVEAREAADEDRDGVPNFC